MNWVDRLTAPIAPRWTLRRQRARVASETLARHFEGASAGRRTQGWHRSSGDANAAAAGAIGPLRDHARDLVRNNPYCESAVSTIVDHTVGWGITAAPAKGTRKDISARALELWKAWAETSACDADGRQDLYGLQKLIMRTVVESGECLIRRRWRRPEDNLPIPLQLQVLEPDHLDPMKDAMTAPGGGQIVQGIELDGIGRRVAYWLLRHHPGAQIVGQAGYGLSDRIPASEILHVFKQRRPGQLRGFSWFAPVMLRLKDFDEYEDAALMKQKIAACLAVITSDADGSSLPLGDTDSADPIVDRIGPGMIIAAPPGREVSVVQPPTVREHSDYAPMVLRAIASGLGMTYEDLTGDYAGMPFSAARMSRLRHWARVEDWRWGMLIPQFCVPVWWWAMEAAGVGQNGQPGLAMTPAPSWTAPPAPMIDPGAEGLAYMRNIRAGILTHSEALRERGYDPDEFLAEYAEDMKKLDELGIVLDSDARRTTQGGQVQAPPEPAGDAAPAGDDQAEQASAYAAAHRNGRMTWGER